MDLGYSIVLLDDSRHARFLQRSGRRQELLSSQNVECEMDHSIPDQDGIDEDSTAAQSVDVSCQTDSELLISVLEQRVCGNEKGKC